MWGQCADCDAYDNVWPLIYFVPSLDETRHADPRCVQCRWEMRRWLAGQGCENIRVSA